VDKKARKARSAEPRSRERERLTSLAIKNITKPGVYHDGGGLYLQVSPLSKGSKSWFLRYRLGGKVRDMGLGSVLDWPLAKVRERAKHYRRMVDDKIDPIHFRNAQLAAQLVEANAIDSARRNQRTFEEATRECFDTIKSKWKNEKHRAQWISSLEMYAFPIVGKLPISTIGKRELEAVLAPIWLDKVETSDRVLQRMRTVLEWASAREYIANYNPNVWIELKSLLPGRRKSEENHFASCPYVEVAELLVALRKSTISDVLKLAFEYMVLTVARSSEVRGAEKVEINFDARTWTIPAARMKLGKQHVVPLSTRALHVLENAFSLEPESPLVFPGRATSKPFSDQAFTKVVLRETLGSQYTAHGFRSSFRMWAGEKTNYERVVCELALAHDIKSATEAAYDRSDYESKRRKLMQDWAKFVAASG
jgi:integrase